MDIDLIENAYENLSKNVKRLRVKSGLSQEKLAERCNISTNCISEFERLKKSPNVKTVINIAYALGIEPYKLFLGNDYTNEKQQRKKELFDEFKLLLEKYLLE